ncbi:MAG: 30S ribosome-binding factor RbfA [Acidobacteria bacterium]|nr:30S ribosome-binding factor RbfA [Acidobacteriota bacterium]
MDERRVQRVSEAIREELAELIGFELEDPRLASVDVTEVQISPDSRHCHVKVNLGGDEHQQEQALSALDHARHYLRHELASRLNLRKVPELHFEADRWADVDGRIELLLKRAKKKRGPTENQP